MIERLRNDEKVRGYRRKMGSQWFFSTDLYAWSGKAIGFVQSDRSTGVKDKNRRLLFEGDILFHPVTGYLEISYDAALQQFLLYAMEQDELLPFEWLCENEYSGLLEWRSYRFHQDS